jgi:hypothetical protein
MPSSPLLKILLSVPLAGGEALMALLPRDLRNEARKAGAVVLTSLAEVATSFAERAEARSAPEREEYADAGAYDESLRNVHVE